MGSTTNRLDSDTQFSVFSLANLPAPVAGVITLESGVYSVKDSFSTPDRFLIAENANVVFRGDSNGEVRVTYTGIGDFFSGEDIDSLRIIDLSLASSTSTEWAIDINQVQNEIVHVSIERSFITNANGHGVRVQGKPSVGIGGDPELSTVIIDGSDIRTVKCLGDIRDVKVVTFNLASFKDFEQGWFLKDIPLIVNNVSEMLLGTNIIGTKQFFIFDGTIESIIFTANTYMTGALESIFDVRMTAVVGSFLCVGNAHDVESTGDVFAAGSQMQETRYFLFKDNINMPETSDEFTLFREIGTPDTPDSNLSKFYYKPDGMLYLLDDSGLENLILYDAPNDGRMYSRKSVGWVEDNAADTSYDNTASGLVAKDVQEAIDELDEIKIDDAYSVGGGAEVFKEEINTSLVFRTLHSSDGSLTIAQNADDVDITLNAPYGFMYITNNAMATSGTGLNKIAGTYAAPAFLNKFTHSGGTLTYIGASTITAVISFTISCIVNIDNFEVFEFVVKVNGVSQTQIGCTTTSNGDDPASIPIQVPVQLSTNDTIEVFADHVSGASDFTVVEMQVSVR